MYHFKFRKKNQRSAVLKIDAQKHNLSHSIMKYFHFLLFFTPSVPIFIFVLFTNILLQTLKDFLFVQSLFTSVFARNQVSR